MDGATRSEFRKGASWNESETYRDAVSLRRGRRLTTRGEQNVTPSYHTDSCFTADGRFLVFGSCRGGLFAVCKAEVATGVITVLTEPIAAARLYPDEVSFAAEAGWVLYNTRSALAAVQIDTLEERSLRAVDSAVERLSIAGITADGSRIAYTVFPVPPPEIAASGDTLAEYRYFTETAGMWIRLCETDLAGTPERLLYSERECCCGHVQYAPGNSDSILMDKGYAPLFDWGSDGVRNRVHVFERSTGRTRPFVPRCGKPFQVHSTWSFDGRRILYHGWLGRTNHSGWYFCVLGADGTVEREFEFPGAVHYGHISAAADRPALILDGNLTPDLLLWLYLDRETPRLEVIGRHGTEWGSQASHPHAHNSRDGRWLSFNAARDGRVDVCVLEI